MWFTVVKDAEDQRMLTTNRPLNLLIVLICFFPLLFLGLFDLDEGVFAATSMQMVIESEYLLPMIGDELRIEKPILSYWIQALFITIFGFSEYAVRAPSLIAAVLWGYCFATFVKENNSRFTRSDILINFFTLPGIFIISFAATADAFLNLFITLSLINLFKFEEQNNQKYLNIAAVNIALGFLTKGFAIIAICGLIFFTYCLFNKKIKVFFRGIFSYKAWLIFLFIAAPWFIFLFIQTDYASISYLLFGQSFGRFSDTFENHGGTFFYYFIIFPLIVLPFFFDAVKGIYFSKPRANSFELFMLTWFFVVFIFFSFSSTKLPHYLIYGLAPIAYFVEKNFRKDENKKFSFLGTFYQIFTWSLFLLLPFCLMYMLDVTQSLEVSKQSVEDFASNISYKIFIGLVMLIIIVCYLTNKFAYKVKKMSAVFLIVLLTFWIMPFAQNLSQQDIKLLGLYAKNTNYSVSMYKVNKPSFAFYANKISYRGLREDHLILSRIDKENSFNFEYEVIMRSGNYFIFKIKSD